MMEFERVSGGEEEAEDAISAISALAEANFKSVGRQPQDNRTKLRPQRPREKSSSGFVQRRRL